MVESATSPELSPTLKEAIALIESGQANSALANCRSRVLTAVQAGGEKSRDVYNQRRDLAWVLWWTGNQSESLQEFKQAIEIGQAFLPIPVFFNSVVQYSLLLAQAGDLANAAKELESRLGALPVGQHLLLEAQAKFILAKLYLYQANLDQSRFMIDQALACHGSQRSKDFFTSLALRAEIRKAISQGNDSFADFPLDKPEELDLLATAVLSRLPESDPVFLADVIEDLLNLCLARKCEDLVWRVQSEKANVLGVLGRHKDRISLVREMRDSKGLSYFGWIELTLGLALCLAESLDYPTALKEYQNALQALNQEHSSRLCFQARFQCALLLDQMGKFTEAVSLFQQAANDAYGENDLLSVLRVRGAMGVLRIHQNRVDEGLADLRQAIEGLPPEDPYSLQARNHWELLQEKKRCLCFDSVAQRAIAIRARVLSEMAGGLARSLNMTWDGEHFQYQFDFARTPSPQQEQRIQELIQKAEFDFPNENQSPR
ncbi:MAG: hypothetical protein EXR99_12650 [Gemmataceae bacterium]|nr:hypothetical protein [Gemmataceae bacterium]